MHKGKLLRQRFLDHFWLNDRTIREIGQLIRINSIFTWRVNGNLRKYGYFPLLPLLVVVALFSYLPPAVWLCLLLFVGMVIGTGINVDSSWFLRSFLSLGPFSDKGKILYCSYQQIKAVALSVFICSLLIFLPHVILERNENILLGIALWLLYAPFLIITILTFIRLIFISLKYFNHYFLLNYAKGRWYSFFFYIGLVFCFLTNLMNIFAQPWTSPEETVELFSFSPFFAPFVIPLNELFMMSYHWEITPMNLLVMGTMIIAFPFTQSLYQRLELWKRNNPIRPMVDNFHEYVREIRLKKRERKHMLTGRREDILLYAGFNVKKAEELVDFRFDIGAEALNSHFTFFQLRQMNNASLCYIVFGCIIYYLFLVGMGLWVPIVFFISYAVGFMLMGFLHENSMQNLYLNLQKHWRTIVYLVPDSRRAIEKVLMTRIRHVRVVRLKILGVIIIASILTIFGLSFRNGDKIPIPLFLIASGILVPIASWASYAVYFLVKKRKFWVNIPIAIYLLVLGIYNFMFLFAFFAWSFSWYNYALFFVINLGVGYFARYPRRTLINKLFHDKKNLGKSLASHFMIFILLGISIASVIQINSSSHLFLYSSVDEDRYWEPSGGTTNTSLRFEDHVVINSTILIENSSIFFADDYFNDLIMYVKENGSLTIRNSTMDAEYQFSFISVGDLILENVTIDHLYGSRYSYGLVGGLYSEGNTTILNSTIRNSGAAGIRVRGGNFTMRNSEVVNTKGSAIDGKDTEILIVDCTFRENGNSAIELERCSATIRDCTFYYHKLDAIDDEGDNDLFIDSNTFHDDPEEVVSGWAVAGFLLLVFFIIALPGIVGYWMDTFAWNKLTMDYGISRKDLKLMRKRRDLIDPIKDRVKREMELKLEQHRYND